MSPRLVPCLLALACSSAPIGEQMPDFELEDINPASSTHGETMSPRDLLGANSAWYFGHTT